MPYGKKPIGTIAYLGGIVALPELFVWSWSQMIQYNAEYLCEPNETVYYDRATVSYHVFARNSLVDRMQGDWLLMLDTDHKFEPDLAVRMEHLMRKYNLDVLTGLYLYKQSPHAPVLYRRNSKGGFETLGKWEEKRTPYLIPIGSAGAGCLMVKRSVFQRIKDELKEGPFDVIHPYSEDHSFLPTAS